MNTHSAIIEHKASLWMSQEYLQTNTDVDYGYLRVAKSRARGKKASWRNDCINGVSYFDVNFLPEKYRTQLPDLDVLRSFCDKKHDDASELINEAVYNSFKAFLKYYSNYEYKQSKALAQAAAIISEAAAYVELRSISFSKSTFFESLANEVKAQELKYLPITWRNIRDKVQQYASGVDITEIIGAKNIGNDNRVEFKNNAFITEHLIALAGSQANYPAAYIYRKIRLICQQNGMDKHPSERWISGEIAKPETKYLIHKRYGENTRFNAHYRGYTPGATALFAGDAWMIDGTRVNIIDHRATTVEKGKRVSKQKFLYIVAVRDVMSGLPVGWEYCYDESAQAVINALAMAVRNTGYLPYELIYDRFPGHTSDDWRWLEAQLHFNGVKMTVTHKAEGKAQMERWFGTLQSVFMTDSRLYYGEGIRSTHNYAHRSKEYISDMRSWAAKNNFNFDDAVRETDTIIGKYINTKYSDYSRKYANIDKSPLQLHDESDKPNVTAINHAHFCYLFGLRKQVSIRNYMIQTQIEGATYYYGIDDVNLIEKYTAVKLWNCFDHEDLSRVHLFDGDTYLGTFDEITPAQRFGPNKDMRAVGITKKLAADNKANREQKLSKITSDATYQISSEVGILQGGNIAKKLYEQAETAFLQQEWEDEKVDITVRRY